MAKEKMQFKCKDCPYFWQEDWEDYAHCHYNYYDGCAPCELFDLQDCDD